MSMTAKGALLTTVAALSLTATGAFAEKHAEANAEAMGTETQTMANLPTYNETYNDIADTQFAELMGMNVLSESGDDVGEVDNFVLLDGELKAVVGVGGFLGLGEHDVAISLDDMTYNGDALVLAFTREELEAMPEYTEELEQQMVASTDTLNTYRGPVGGMEPSATEGEALADGETTIDVDAEAGETDMAEADAENTDTMTEEVAETETEVEQETEELTADAEQAVEETAEETEQMADNAADTTEAAADEAGQELAEAGEATENAIEDAGTEVAEAGEATENAVEGAADEAGQELAEAGEATENAVEDAGTEVAEAADATENAVEGAADEAGQELAEAGEATENAVEGAADATGDALADAGQATENAVEGAVATAGTWMDKLEAEFADIASMPVNELVGTNVATPSGEVIGEIDQIGRDGDTMVAVVGIGGFLGLGEHDVALDLADLGWDGENFVTEGMTEEELKNMAEVDMDTIEPLDGDITLTAAADM